MFNRYYWISFFLLILLTLSVILLLFFFQLFTVSGQSMYPQFHSSDKVIILKNFPFTLKEHQVVVLKTPFQGNKNLIKRIFALPGQKLILKGTTICHKNTCDPLDPKEYHYWSKRLPLVVPQGQIFVLGDNWKVSYDSRDFGWVPIANIKGLVIYQFS